MEEENWQNDSEDEFMAAREQVSVSRAGKYAKRAERAADSDAVLDVKSAQERYLAKLEQKQLSDSEEELYLKRGDDDDAEGDEDQQGESWGGKGEYYAEAEDEEVGKEDVEEALRLQRQHMAQLGMDDYMLEEAEAQWEHQDDEEQEQQQEQDTTKSGALSMYPEYVPLLEELKDLRQVLDQVQGVQKQVLSGYLGVIVCYLGILRSKIASGDSDGMKDESVMLGILSWREMWRQAQATRVSQDSGEDEQSEEEEEVEEGEEEQAEQPDSESESGSGSESAESEAESSPEEQDFAVPRRVKRLDRQAVDSLEQQEHRGRRRGLRFYTSKINRERTGQTFTGDEDLSYAESEFERRRRLQKEAVKRGGRSGPGEDLM